MTEPAYIQAVPPAPADPTPPGQAGAGLPYLDMRAIMDDGTEYMTHADQRDMRRAQVAVGVDPERDPLGFARATAWSYLQRTGVIETGWKDFDRDAAFVIPLEDQTVADPTGPAPAG